MRVVTLSIFLSCLLAPAWGCAGPTEWVRVDDPLLMPPELHREFRGLWVATVDNIDWPSEPGLSKAEQQAEALEILELAAELNLNTIVLQVRPAADALYKSSLEPWSAYLSGNQGQSPGYDPLEFWIEESHARGLDLHAWVNPFRAWHPSMPGEAHHKSVVAKQPEYLIEHGEYLWLDPGDSAARKYSLQVIRDIAQRYDIDGIHVDDYFYPYPIEDAPFADSRSFDEYVKQGGDLDRKQWRRWNIDRFVRDLYTQVKKSNPGVLVGVSPFGIWRPGFPEQVVGFDAFEELAADARRWLQEGWLDYASPQLYWKIESPGQPFEPLLNWWTSQNTASRHVWPGLYLTRIKEDSGWAPKDITDQVQIIQGQEQTNGFVLFSAIGLIQDRQNINTGLKPVLDSFSAVPDSTWLGLSKIPKPNLSIRRAHDTYLVRQQSLQDAQSTLGWLLWTRYGNSWTSRFVSRDDSNIELDFYRVEEPLLAVAAQAWAGSGRYSEPALYHRLVPPPAIPADEIRSAAQRVTE
jgi:uncharacterized lipoprotein YddW (UPF0748 family)